MVVNTPDTLSNPYCGQGCSSHSSTTCISSESSTKYSDNATLVWESPAAQQYDQTLWPPKPINDTNNTNNTNNNNNKNKNDNNDLKPSSQTISDDVKLRQQALNEVLRQVRLETEAEYLRTSDASVFDPYLAPFVAGMKGWEREWVLDQPTQRWYLYDPGTEEALWCPTADSFA